MEKNGVAELLLMEVADVASEPRDSQRCPVLASHSRYTGDYVYDIEVHQAQPPTATGRCCAHVLNLRLESGRAVSIDAELQLAYGATPYEAFERIEAAVARWVKDLTRSH